MCWVEKPLVLGLGVVWLAAAARADVTEPPNHSYQVVLDRNPFGLKPTPAPPTTAPPTNPVTPVNIKMTGITSDANGKKAYLMIPPSPGKTSPQYFSIPEHEKQGDIEVLEIDEKEGTVKILSAGTATELNFKDNGLPTPAAAAIPGGPVMPHGVPGVMPTPGIVPAPTTPAPVIKTAGATPAVPSYNMNEAMAARYGLQPTTTANTAARTIPARNVRTLPVVPQAQPTQTSVDPAVQRIIMEAQKVQAERQGQAFPPLPPFPGGR